MNRLAYFVLGSSFVFAGSALVVGGCGSSDVTVADAPDTGGSSSGSSGTSGTSGSSGSSSGDATTDTSTVTEAGKDAAPEASGDASALTSDPGKVTCGSMSCDLTTDTCCRTFSGSTCVATGGACNGGVTEACDEKADCPGTDNCCSNGFTSTSCTATCGATDYQICKTDAECGAAGTCYVNKCNFAGTTQIIPSCTPIAQCTH